MRWVDFVPANYIYMLLFELPVLVICPLKAHSETTLSRTQGCAMSRGSQTPIELTYDVVSERGRFAASNLQNAEPVPEWDIRPGPGTGDLDMAGRAAMTVMPPSMCGETIVDQ
jgi:hypothetical protein